jgi:hypothetical protein
VLTVSLLSFLPVDKIYAQASLASENIISEAAVTLNGVQESFTLIRDAQQEDQWYYVPDRPRLFERSFNGALEPEFSLIRYQFPDRDNPPTLIEGGMLQFAATLAVPPAALDQLKARIRKHLRNQNAPVRLAALPFKSADVHLYSPESLNRGESGKLLKSAPKGEGIAPIFATQKMIFSMPLTNIGTEVYDTLINGNTGVPVAVEFTYQGLTPPASFEIEVNWEKIRDFYSKDIKFRAEASYFGLFGASYEGQWQHIWNKLKEDGRVKITKVDNSEAVEPKVLEENLTYALQFINTKLLENFKAPPEVSPAQATSPSARGFFGSAGYSSAINSRVDISKLDAKITYSGQRVVERKTIAAGFIGIGGYPQGLRNRLVTVVSNDTFKKAAFILPPTANAEEWGIIQIDLEIGVIKDDLRSNRQLAIWTPAVGWKDASGASRTSLVFGLLGFTDPDIHEAEFEIKTKITTANDIVESIQRVPAFNGTSAVSAINTAVLDVVAVDASGLRFRQLNNTFDLVSVNGTLQIGGKQRTFTLRPQNINGVVTPPRPSLWLVPKKDQPDPIIANITFQLKSGTRSWRNNGSNLREKGLYVYLDNDDWMKH